MNNQQMVSVPREWAELLVEAGPGEAVTSAELKVLKDILAQPAEVTGNDVLRWMDEHAAAQSQDEPVAVFHIDRTGYRVKVLDSATLPADGTKLYTRNVTMPGQGEPVAYIRQKDIERLLSPHVAGCAASLEKEPRDGFVAFYTHADAGKVERLREENKQLREIIEHSDANIGRQSLRIFNQRAQLAERDALLLRAVNGARFTLPDQWYRDYIALSASAEPSAPKCETCDGHGAVGNILNAEPCPDCSYSAPVERDERAEFEKAYTDAVEIGWSNVKHLARLMWMTRAALERKP